MNNVVNSMNKLALRIDDIVYLWLIGFTIMFQNKSFILSILFICFSLVGLAETNWSKHQFEKLLIDTKKTEKEKDSLPGTNESIEVLKNALNNGIEKFPELQADYFLALQMFYLKIGDKATRDYYLEKAGKLLDQPHLRKSLWKYHLEKGHAVIDIQNYDAAKKYYLLAIDGLSETDNKEQLVSTMLSLATSLKIQNSDDSSILLYKKAIQLAEKYGMQDKTLISKSRLGNLLHNNNKVAAEYFHDIYTQSKAMGDTRKHVVNCIDMAKLYIVSGEHKKAIEYYDEAIMVANKADEQSSTSKFASAKSRLNLLKAEQLIALRRYVEANSLLDETEFPLLNQYSDCYKKLLKGKVYRGLGKKKQSIKAFRYVINHCKTVLDEKVHKELNTIYFDIANYLYSVENLNAALDTINIGLKSDNLDLKTRVDCYDIKSKIHEQQGNYKLSLIALQQKNVFLDSLIGLNSIGTYLTEQANLEVFKKEKEIEKLEVQKFAMQNETRQNRNIIFGLLLGILALAIGSWFYSRHRKVALEKDLAEVKQNLLRIQINPHFIFNALNSIQSSFLMDDQEKTLHLFNKFSNLMRQILENSNNSFIPLNEELELLINYMELEKVRSNNKFDYEVEIDEGIDIYNEEIPSMVLQIFVENSIWHGVIPKEDRGLIKLKVAKENNNIKISVVDDGVGRTFSIKHKSKDQQRKNSLGTKLVAQRIDLLNRKFGKKLQLDILDGPSEGTVVELVI